MAQDLPTIPVLQRNIQVIESTDPGFAQAYFELAKFSEGIEIDRNKVAVNPHYKEKFAPFTYRLIHTPEVLRVNFGITMDANMCVDGWGGAYNLSVAPEFKELLARIEAEPHSHASGREERAGSGLLTSLLSIFRSGAEATR